ncbi:Flp1 family type IVb pilin [Cohnella sp. AR92]|uniref:Flp1 family type IVb pilin n=1 Tax=Cohnella sp. AR92 TaxID=648716 RepID=UPI00186440EB|nr:Flp1 family type IVb pilin [Cohnella sp. AR92]
MLERSKRLQRWSARGLTMLWKDKSGLGTLEIVLIAAVIIAIAILFKDWIIDFLQSLFGKVESSSDEVFN